MKSKDFTDWDAVTIAPRRDGGDWTVADYKAIDFNTEEGWQCAITIFEDRIRGRFLDVVQCIANQPDAGFAVMALDCLLIETLQQTRQGVAETPRGKGEEYFVNFLIYTAFASDFDEHKAKAFYKHIRNGILHQAEIKGSSRIRTDSDLPIVQYAPDNKGLIINRRKFHQKLVQVFDDFIADLRNPANQSLRDHLRQKLDAICQIKRSA